MKITITWYCRGREFDDGGKPKCKAKPVKQTYEFFEGFYEELHEQKRTNCPCGNPIIYSTYMVLA